MKDSRCLLWDWTNKQNSRKSWCLMNIWRCPINCSSVTEQHFIVPFTTFSLKRPWNSMDPLKFLKSAHTLCWGQTGGTGCLYRVCFALSWWKMHEWSLNKLSIGNGWTNSGQIRSSLKKKYCHLMAVLTYLKDLFDWSIRTVCIAAV